MIIILLAIGGVGLAEAQSALPHFAAGGGFVTGYYVVNTGSQAAKFSIAFHDDAGRSVTLSFTGLGSLAILSDSLPAGGAKYYEADSPTGGLLSGAGIITADAGINIQALFRRRGSSVDYSEAAVPSSPGANQILIPFDDTVFAPNGAQIYTGLAIVNTDALVTARITCTARDSQGAVIANALSIPVLNQFGHWAGYDFPALLGKRGSLDCSSNARIAAVALRFMGNTMSSLPVVANSSTTQAGLRVLPHLAAGGGFTTAFYVVNTGSQPAGYGVKFVDDNGNRVKLSVAGMGSVDEVTENLPARGSRYFEADSPTGGLLSGAGYVSGDPAVTVQAVFRRRGSAGDYSEAAIPASFGATKFTIPFDDTVFAEGGSQIYTGLALANMDAQIAHVTCTARDAQGTVIANAVSVPTLPGYGHWSGYQFPALLGKRGTLACTSDLAVAPVALRFLGNAMSSLPVIPGVISTGSNSGSGLQEFRTAKFSFQYPANFTISFNGTDPSDRRFTLVQLTPNDKSFQLLEVRYAAHSSDDIALWSINQQLTANFNLTKIHGFYLDWTDVTETSESGAVTSEIMTGSLRNPNIDVLGASIWSHSDFAQISFGYDRSVASRSVRDTVFRSLTFASQPSLPGRWANSSGTDLFFYPDGRVDVTLGSTASTQVESTGQYSFSNDRLDISYRFAGTLITWQCGYTLTLANLRMDCGANGSRTLTTRPDLQ
jgi:hypothetical protein